MRQTTASNPPAASSLTAEFDDQHGRREGMAAVEAYCVKCREKREIKDPQEVTLKNGRPALKGTCAVCGTGLFRMLSTSGGGAAASDEPKKEKKEKKETKAKKK
jgi:hypothetical protein